MKPDAATSFARSCRGKSLYLATPMYSGQCHWAYAKGLLDVQRVCEREGIGFYTGVITGSSIITQARNELVAEFLASKATHLIFIDADIEFQAEAVFELLALDRDIVGALYPTKRIDWDRVHDAVTAGCPREQSASLRHHASKLAWRPLTGSVKITSSRQPIEVESLATGFLMISRPAIERFIAAFPERSVQTKHRDIPLVFDFRFDPATRKYWGEDYAFCLDWRALGGQIWCCPWIRLGHIGQQIFTGTAQFARLPHPQVPTPQE